MTIGLEYVLQKLEVGITELSKELNIPRNSVCSWISDKQDIPVKYQLILSSKYKIPATYLRRSLDERDKREIDLILTKYIENKKYLNMGCVEIKENDKFLYGIIEKKNKGYANVSKLVLKENLFDKISELSSYMDSLINWYDVYDDKNKKYNDTRKQDRQKY